MKSWDECIENAQEWAARGGMYPADREPCARMATAWVSIANALVLRPDSIETNAEAYAGELAEARAQRDEARNAHTDLAKRFVEVRDEAVRLRDAASASQARGDTRGRYADVERRLNDALMERDEAREALKATEQVLTDTERDRDEANDMARRRAAIAVRLEDERRAALTELDEVKAAQQQLRLQVEAWKEQAAGMQRRVGGLTAERDEAARLRDAAFASKELAEEQYGNVVRERDEALAHVETLKGLHSEAEAHVKRLDAELDREED